jgi:hypothetical protein
MRLFYVVLPDYLASPCVEGVTHHQIPRRSVAGPYELVVIVNDDPKSFRLVSTDDHSEGGFPEGSTCARLPER